MEECYLCKKKVDKLYEFRGWRVCWDCYFKEVDKDMNKKLTTIAQVQKESSLGENEK